MIESDGQNYINRKSIEVHPCTSGNNFKCALFSNYMVVCVLSTVALPGCCQWVLPN